MQTAQKVGCGVAVAMLAATLGFGAFHNYQNDRRVQQELLRQKENGIELVLPKDCDEVLRMTKQENTNHTCTVTVEYTTGFGRNGGKAWAQFAKKLEHQNPAKEQYVINPYCKGAQVRLVPYEGEH